MVYAAAPAAAGCAPPPHSRAYIAFDELPDENWAIAGKLLDEESRHAAPIILIN